MLARGVSQGARRLGPALEQRRACPAGLVLCHLAGVLCLFCFLIAVGGGCLCIACCSSISNISKSKYVSHG